MNKLFNAMNATARTANGAATNFTSKDPIVDLFGLIGASRGKDLTALFRVALAADQDLAIRTLLYSRDVRGGMGERQMFRDLVKDLADKAPSLASRVMLRIPELGRYDDLKAFEGTSLWPQALALWMNAIVAERNPLAAKWAPRKGSVFVAMHKYLDLTPKSTRKILVSLTREANVPEVAMCARQWENINYGKLASKAAARYRKAFEKHDPIGYEEYVSKLEKGEAKVSAKAIFPHDIIKGSGNTSVMQAQWDAQPDYLEGTNSKILPVIDVSGSMTIPTSAMSSVTCMDVAIALGIYCAERNTSLFQDCFISFSERPRMHSMPKGGIADKVKMVRSSPWGYNTDLLKVFGTLLQVACQRGLTQEDMPTKVIIFSDMEFDSACENNDLTALEHIKKLYAQSGFEIPELVFWNLRGHKENLPITVDDRGVCLVSGFSPAIMKSVLASNIVTPMDLVKQAVCNERYDY